jgi:hypothetical protein
LPPDAAAEHDRDVYGEHGALSGTPPNR